MSLKQSSSERVQRRYILIEGIGKDEVNRILEEYLGVKGLSKASPLFVEHVNGIVLSVLRKEVDDVRAAFEMSNTKGKIKRVSGTIKGLDLK